MKTLLFVRAETRLQYIFRETKYRQTQKDEDKYGTRVSRGQAPASFRGDLHGGTETNSALVYNLKLTFKIVSPIVSKQRSL